MNLKGLNREIKGCRLCDLATQRNQVVPGTGSAKSKLMFIAEAPGREENWSGIPLDPDGDSGNFFQELIEMIGLTRDELFIANLLKCRPPENRDPRKNEITQCEDFLLRQIEIIRPKIIVTLGAFALQWFLPKEKITKEHGTHETIDLSDWEIGMSEVELVKLAHPSPKNRSISQEEQIEDFQVLETLLIT